MSARVIAVVVAVGLAAAVILGATPALILLALGLISAAVASLL